MEIIRKIFPESQAPETARKKVMQHIYWNSQKTFLNKKIYFNNIYAPVFIVLILFIWFLLYPKQIPQENNFKNDSISTPKTVNEISTLSLESNTIAIQNSENYQLINTNQAIETQEIISYRKIDSSNSEYSNPAEGGFETDQKIIIENNNIDTYEQDTDQYNKSLQSDALMLTMIADDASYSQTQSNWLNQTDNSDIQITINKMLDTITNEENISPNDLSLSNENKIYQLDNLEYLLAKNTDTSDSIFYNNEKIKLYKDQLSSLKINLENIKNSSDQLKNPDKSQIKYYNNILKDILKQIKSEILEIENTEYTEYTK